MYQQRSASVVDGMPMAPANIVAKNKTRRFSCPPVNAVDMSVNIKRAPLTQVAFDELHLKSDQESTPWSEKLKMQCYCSKHRLWKIITAYFPIIKVIRYYKIKENMVTDILSGITVGVLHIPQALAFGLLTSVKVEGGLYTSVWPVLLYVIFGTSPHVSMGTSAVISIVTAAVVDREADTFKLQNRHLLNRTENGTESDVWENIPEFMDFKEGVSMSIAFFTGIILLAMGLLRLGFITAYLSDSFFSAFTSGAGVHIAISQTPAIFGLKVPRFGGNFKIFKTCAAIFGAITEVNVAALIIAVISGIIILIVKDCINERFKHKLIIPIPIELFIVVGTTLISYLVGLKEKFNVEIVEFIPQTIPPPQIPHIAGAENYIVDCFVMAILIFANTIAMAKICAKRHNYELDDSQELIAYGMCNFGSSFFKCFPSAVAPPRSMVASSMNTKSTISGIFSMALMLLLILVMSPLFEPLPKTVLAAIIVVALKGLFMQLNICVKYWKVNKIDFVIWFFTFFSVVFLDIDYGLGIGVGVALITVVFQTQFARGYRVGRTIKDTALVEHKKYSDAMEVPGIKIFRFHSNLYFANAEIFRTALYRSTVNPRKILKYLKKMEKKKAKDEKERKVSRDSSVQYDNKIGNGISIIENSVKIDLNDKDGTMSGTNDNGNTKMKFQRLDSLSSVNSRKSSLTGVDNPVYKDDVQLTGSNGHLNIITPREVTLLKRNMSISSLTTLGSEAEDPEDGSALMTDEKFQKIRRIHHVIIDCAPINYLDTSGANVLTHIFTEYDHVNIKLYLARVSYDVRQTMEHAGVFDKIPRENIFLDVPDATAVARMSVALPFSEDLEDFSYEEATEDSYVAKM